MYVSWQSICLLRKSRKKVKEVKEKSCPLAHDSFSFGQRWKESPRGYKSPSGKAPGTQPFLGPAEEAFSVHLYFPSLAKRLGWDKAKKKG